MGPKAVPDMYVGKKSAHHSRGNPSEERGLVWVRLVLARSELALNPPWSLIDSARALRERLFP